VDLVPIPELVGSEPSIEEALVAEVEAKNTVAESPRVKAEPLVPFPVAFRDRDQDPAAKTETTEAKAVYLAASLPDKEPQPVY